MKRMVLIALVLCLLMLTTVGAGVVVAKQQEKVGPLPSLSSPRAPLPLLSFLGRGFMFDVTYQGTVVGKIYINTNTWWYFLYAHDLTPGTEYWLTYEGRGSTIASATANANGNLLMQGVLNPAPNVNTKSPTFFLGTGTPPPGSGSLVLDGKECRGAASNTAVFGTLKSGTTGLSGQKIDLYTVDPVTLEWTSYGSTTTDSNGKFCNVHGGGHAGYKLAMSYSGQYGYAEDMNIETATTCPIC